MSNTYSFGGDREHRAVMVSAMGGHHEADGAIMPPEDSIDHVLVVGSSGGIGRWMIQSILGGRRWASATLCDQLGNVDMLAELGAGLSDHVTVAYSMESSPDQFFDADDDRPITTVAPDTVVLVAVPAEARPGVARWLAGLTVAPAQVVVAGAPLEGITDALAVLPDPVARYGLHPLFDIDITHPFGQIVVVSPLIVDSPAPLWLIELLERVGAFVNFDADRHHDAAMNFVQTLTHQALLAFVQSLVDSGLDLQRDLWDFRTPLFESLLSLATRVLSERGQGNLARIQVSSRSHEMADALGRAMSVVATAVESSDTASVEALVAHLRSSFGAEFFPTISAAATASVNAVQSSRLELARKRNTAELTGLRMVGRPDSLRVGRITHVSSDQLEMDELLVGKRGNAALLSGPGIENARKAGLNGTPRHTRFSLGRIELLRSDELEAALDAWLASLTRDVRFLVPESIGGEGVIALIRQDTAVQTAEVCEDVVRTGQRSVIVRIAMRVDIDAEELIEALRRRVNAAYAWPHGVSLRARAAAIVNYLGPAGTFSAAAAVHCAEAAGLVEARLVAHASFPDVLAATGPDALAVLPIVSSASGLVTRAADALLEGGEGLRAGGVADVAVRFDAYIRPGDHLHDLRNAPVYGHPQGLAQCTRFVQRWNLVPVPCDSNVVALHWAAASDIPCVALAGPDLEVDSGLKVAEREVDDLAGSITRFLLLGRSDAFGSLIGGSVPTLRSLYVARSITALFPLLSAAEPAFDEFLSDAAGNCLWVTSRDPSTLVPDGVRSLGRIPWSPRTPLVRADSNEVFDAGERQRSPARAAEPGRD